MPATICTGHLSGRLVERASADHLLRDSIVVDRCGARFGLCSWSCIHLHFDINAQRLQALPLMCVDANDAFQLQVGHADEIAGPGRAVETCATRRREGNTAADSQQHATLGDDSGGRAAGNQYVTL